MIPPSVKMNPGRRVHCLTSRQLRHEAALPPAGGAEAKPTWVAHRPLLAAVPMVVRPVPCMLEAPDSTES